MPIPSGITRLDCPVLLGEYRPVTITADADWPDGITIVGGPDFATEATVTVDGHALTFGFVAEDIATVLGQPYRWRHDGRTFVDGWVFTASGVDDPVFTQTLELNPDGVTFTATLALPGASGGGGGGSLLFHQSWRRYPDGAVGSGVCNGEGSLGAFPWLDATTLGAPTVVATVEDGALCTQGGAAAVVLVYADVEDYGRQFRDLTSYRVGFMFGGWADEGPLSELDDSNGTEITIVSTSATGDGPVFQMNTKNIAGERLSHVRLGLDVANVFNPEAEVDMYRDPLPGDTFEMEVIKDGGGAGSHTAIGYWNGVEVDRHNFTFDWAALGTFGTPIDNSNVDDTDHWRGRVLDQWMTTGGAWWPGEPSESAVIAALEARIAALEA